VNTEQAKKIDFPSLLLHLGFEPVKIAKQGLELWYNSPFRAEKTASFHTSFLGGKWIWKDFGDIGGTVIDFVMKHQNTDVKGALAFLDRRAGLPKIKPTIPVNTDIQKPIEQSESKSNIFTLKDVKKFASSRSGFGLVEYIITKRCIDREIAHQFLKEIHFINTQNGKNYFAAGIENIKGGYEIRNPFFKGTVPETSKSVSLIRVGEGAEKIICFEGFIDFLSHGSLFGVQDNQDYLILNTVSYMKEAVEMIKKGGYLKVQTFFDNDKAGEEATEYFKKELPNVEAQNGIYAQAKDLNDYITRFKQSEIKK
jgi:5S rRNA maturation endonuclease (ribonuclease M5)